VCASGLASNPRAAIPCLGFLLIFIKKFFLISLAGFDSNAAAAALNHPQQRDVTHLTLKLISFAQIQSFWPKSETSIGKMPKLKFWTTNCKHHQLPYPYLTEPDTSWPSPGKL
jgi:hypothetical protein